MERGSVTVVMGGIVAVTIVLSVAVAAVGSLYGAKTQAETAADAAALAAAVATYPPAAGGEPVSSAADIAARNGARLIRCVCDVDGRLVSRTVLVEISIGARVPIFGAVTVRAASRAEFDPGRWLGP